MKNYLFLLVCFQLINTITGQKINEYAAKAYLLSGDPQAYFSPFVDAMGASIHNSSFSFEQPDSTKNFHIYVGVYASAAFIPESMQSYDGVTISTEGTINAPTIFGRNASNTYYDEQGNAYSYPGGFDISQVNLAFPIIHVGTLFHTNFSGRFFALDIEGDFKRIEIFGVGLNHFISDYWNAANYFVSIGASFNQYKLGDYLKAQHFLVQATAGQQMNKFRYWGFAQWHKSPYEFYYNDAESGSGTVEVDGENNFRLGIGCGIKLSIFYLNAEASFFKPLVGSVGLGLQF
jgi:hypothetical protein